MIRLMLSLSAIFMLQACKQVETGEIRQDSSVEVASNLPAIEDQDSVSTRIVFHDFDGERVTLVRGDQRIIDDALTSADPSNGISKIVSFNLPVGVSKFTLSINGVDREVSLQITNKVRVIYVSARPPYMSTSDVDAILLD